MKPRAAPVPAAVQEKPQASVSAPKSEEDIRRVRPDCSAAQKAACPSLRPDFVELTLRYGSHHRAGEAAAEVCSRSDGRSWHRLSRTDKQHQGMFLQDPGAPAVAIVLDPIGLLLISSLSLLAANWQDPRSYCVPARAAGANIIATATKRGACGQGAASHGCPIGCVACCTATACTAATSAAETCSPDGAAYAQGPRWEGSDACHR